MDVITLRILQGSWVIKMGPTHNDMCSVRDAQTEENMHRRGGGTVNTEAGTGEMWPQAKNCLGLLAASRSWKRQGRILPRAFKGSSGLLTL